MLISLHPQRAADLDLYLGDGLAALAALGAATDHPKLKPARKLAERLPAIRQAAADLYARQDIGAQVAAAAARYLAGNLSTDELPAVAAAIDACAAYDSTPARILDAAQRLVDNETSAACQELGDLWITEILRPAADQQIQLLTPELLELGWTAASASADDRDKQQRDALEQIEAVIAALDHLHNTASGMISFGWVRLPDRPAGWHPEDLRWLHPDQLGPQLRTYIAWLIDGARRGATPGVWTPTEIIEANPTEAPAEPAHQTDDELYAATV